MHINLHDFNYLTFSKNIQYYGERHTKLSKTVTMVTTSQRCSLNFKIFRIIVVLLKFPFMLLSL